jgi:hypothetical protein
LWIYLSRLWLDWRSALAIVNQKQGLPGIVPAFACSGPGRYGAANPDDPSFRARLKIFVKGVNVQQWKEQASAA